VLHWAARRNNIPLLKLLIHYKADVNARDMNGRSPLYVAARMNNVEAVKLLLVNLSYAFAIDKNGIKIEETTVHPEILKMISKGKMVRKFLYN
jgi:ankyrin repeat protein